MSQEEYSVKKRAEGRELNSLPKFLHDEMDEIFEMCKGDQIMLDDIASVVDRESIVKHTNDGEHRECTNRLIVEPQVECGDILVQVFDADVTDIDGLDQTNRLVVQDNVGLVTNFNSLDQRKGSFGIDTEPVIPNHFPKLEEKFSVSYPPGSIDQSQFNSYMMDVYTRVVNTGMYNFQCARVPIPSGLHIDAWRTYLEDYDDVEVCDFLEYGWPSNFNHNACLQSTLRNHKSGLEFGSHIDAYIETELGKYALLGPFSAPPVVPLHLSPVMTRPKKDSDLRRIVVDLSWPHGMAVNDGIPTDQYLDKPFHLTLPTVDYMTSRVRELGSGCFLYKLDLSRGYRQLRLDPLDWPIMSICHRDRFFMDVCPPFGLRTAALMMERTTLAACYIHQLYGFTTKPYIDDFGGAELEYKRASEALSTLQGILKTVGLEEAPHKTVEPTTKMTWLGIDVDSVAMTLSIPHLKLEEIKTVVKSWEGKSFASKKEVQSLMGMLNFVGGVSPPVRIFTNRILNFLRSIPDTEFVAIPSEVREDLDFFCNLMPKYNGISIIDKSLVDPDEQVELDSCLSGCGGLCGQFYYSCQYPECVLAVGHQIAHLEMLNVVVALRLWAPIWSGKKMQVFCDNMNTCTALQTGRTRDLYMQSCVRTIFLITVKFDIELMICHCPGVELVAADSLSRVHTSDRFQVILEKLGCLKGKSKVNVPEDYFNIVD